MAIIQVTDANTAATLRSLRWLNGSPYPSATVARGTNFHVPSDHFERFTEFALGLSGEVWVIA